jgi:hypothetical protein
VLPPIRRQRYVPHGHRHPEPTGPPLPAHKASTAPRCFPSTAPIRIRFNRAIGHTQPANPTLSQERLHGQIGDDGVKRITTWRVLDLLEIPQQARRSGTYRRLAQSMTELGWSAVRVRGLTCLTPSAVTIFRPGIREAVIRRLDRPRFGNRLRACRCCIPHHGVRPEDDRKLSMSDSNRPMLVVSHSQMTSVLHPAAASLVRTSRSRVLLRSSLAAHHSERVLGMRKLAQPS